MKRFTFRSGMAIFLTLLIIPQLASAQGAAINSTGDDPHSSAILDLQSTEKGFLPPRMTTLQRNAIQDPAEGLQIFNTTTKCVEIFVSNNWHNMFCCTVPAQPDVISGPSDICDGSVVTYSVSPLSEATSYNWSVPVGAEITSGQGTPEITVLVGSSSGNVTVAAENSCGSGVSQTLAVTAFEEAVPGSQVFSATGEEQQFVVPPCVTEITIDAYGAAGSHHGFASGGGLGGRAKGTLSVTPGQVLYVYVGQSGDNGAWNGGNSGSSFNGGGASDVRVGSNGLANRVIVAGGGGAAGNRRMVSSACGGDREAVPGGDGGAATGQNGSNAWNSSIGGGGGSQIAGGSAGSGNITPDPPPSAGTLGSGGNGAFNVSGGGGGYYGGGGGGYSNGCNSAAGGGGSNYTGGVTELENQRGVRNGNGEIIISW